MLSSLYIYIYINIYRVGVLLGMSVISLSLPVLVLRGADCHECMDAVAERGRARPVHARVVRGLPRAPEVNGGI